MMDSSALLCPGSSLLPVCSPPADDEGWGPGGCASASPDICRPVTTPFHHVSPAPELPVTACDARDIRAPQPLPPTPLLHLTPFHSFFPFLPSTWHCPLCHFLIVTSVLFSLSRCTCHEGRGFHLLCSLSYHRGHQGASTENMRHETGQHNLSDTPHSPPGKKPGGSAPALLL